MMATAGAFRRIPISHLEDVQGAKAHFDDIWDKAVLLRDAQLRTDVLKLFRELREVESAYCGANDLCRVIGERRPTKDQREAMKGPCTSSLLRRTRRPRSSTGSESNDALEGSWSQQAYNLSGCPSWTDPRVPPKLAYT